MQNYAKKTVLQNRPDKNYSQNYAHEFSYLDILATYFLRNSIILIRPSPTDQTWWNEKSPLPPRWKSPSIEFTYSMKQCYSQKANVVIKLCCEFSTNKYFTPCHHHRQTPIYYKLLAKCQTKPNHRPNSLNTGTGTHTICVYSPKSEPSTEPLTQIKIIRWQGKTSAKKLTNVRKMMLHVVPGWWR